MLPMPHASSQATLRPATPEGGDYERVCAVIEFISRRYRDQPSLGEIAGAVNMGEGALEALFRRWAGLSPKAFLQAVTLDHARRLLAQGMPLFDAAMEVGLSGPSRLHDLFVKHEAVSPGAHKARGAGLDIAYDYGASPFGRALVLWTGRGVAGISFCDDEQGGDEGALADMMRRWPQARLTREPGRAACHLERIFQPEAWAAERPLRLVLIGTDFEIRVWGALLAIPFGQAASYSAIAGRIGAPKAARAVGAAVGRNPISFVVPCHRVVASGGALIGYHWGLTRKRAMLGWEAGVLARG